MDFVTVTMVLNPAEAELIRSRLEANGFLVNIKNEDAAFSFGYSPELGGLQIQVPEADAENARALLKSQGPPAE
jgi:hypothetical protein